jgi:hypothetical protein
VAITFVNPREMRALRIIERVTGAHIRREEVPTVAEVEEREAEMLEERLLATLSKGNWGRYRPIVEELFESHDPIDVAAAALSLAASGGMGRRQTSAARVVPLPERARAEEPERPAAPERPHEPERPPAPDRLAAPDRPVERERPAARGRAEGRDRPVERGRAEGRERRPAAFVPPARRSGRAAQESAPPDRRPRRDAPDDRRRGSAEPDDRRRPAPATNDRRRRNDGSDDRRPMRADLRALADEADEILRGEHRSGERGPVRASAGDNQSRRRTGQPPEKPRPEKPRRQFISFGKPGARRPKQGPRPPRQGPGRRG